MVALQAASFIPFATRAAATASVRSVAGSVMLAKAGDESKWRESFAKMPFGRPATTDEIAATAVFLTSDLCGYTSGTIVTIDGGMTNRGELA